VLFIGNSFTFEHNVPGLVRALAAEAGIEAAAVPRSDYANKGAFETALDQALRQAGATTIALAGFMRILSGGFVARWQGRILNIHPSLLPAFRGLDTHARALAAGVKLHGATVHIVTETLDDGPILAQAAVPVCEGDDEATLAARVLATEHALYPAALARFLARQTLPPASAPLFNPPLPA
ncbi:MAG: phosphoribosylglycinamide formyltransferase, partial [Pseudomonadota bacterium]